MKKGILARPVVLIVEDDELLNLFSAALVAEAGCTALQAENADAAMAMLEAHSNISLLLTDINMPGSMDGVKLAQAVQKRWPAIKIIIVSSMIPACGLPAGSRFLRKPYPEEEMISEIHSLMGGGDCSWRTGVAHALDG